MCRVVCESFVKLFEAFGLANRVVSVFIVPWRHRHTCKYYPVYLRLLSPLKMLSRCHSSVGSTSRPMLLLFLRIATAKSFCGHLCIC